jgi:reactive chlorine resistance protein C
MSVARIAALLGVVRTVSGVLIAILPVWLLESATGSGLAAGMVLTTLTFLITTPGWELSLGGFPVLSGPAGEFLITDVVLLGAALSTAGEALEAAGGGRPAAPLSVR